MVSTGIAFGSMLPGLVPIYEEREAAIFGHYNWTQWQELSHEERSDCVAHYRMNRLIELHRDDALNREMQRRQRKKR